MGFRVEDFGFWVEGLGFWVEGLGFKVWGLGLRVWGLCLGWSFPNLIPEMASELMNNAQMRLGIGLTVSVWSFGLGV